MKKILAMLLAAMAAVSMVACTGTETPDEPVVDETPAVSDTVVDETPSTEVHNFNIYAWNEEFKGFFEAYYEVPEGVTVNWIINPSDGGVYQQKLDEALLNQANADDNDKIDMFLAEADYILKYVDSDYTMGIDEIGYENADTMYQYTIDACTDSNGVCKGVSFQCCPAALIYRRSIAIDVLGTDDPAEVQAALDSWEKFEAVAADAAAKGYLMTASFAETYRTFSNNCTVAWVDDNNTLTFDEGINAWIDQTKNFMDNGYTLNEGVWDQGKTDQMGIDGKTMCFFGPAWYFNFCMGPAHEDGVNGDWAICQGPQAYFWGGTWLLAATGSDDAAILKDVFETFTHNEDVCSKLVSEQSQYPNNTAVVEKFANDATYGSDFLGGQNDIAVFAEMADDIVWQYHTGYDQLLNEGLQTELRGYFAGELTLEEAMNNFYEYVNETYPEIEIAE